VLRCCADSVVEMLDDEHGFSTVISTETVCVEVLGLAPKPAIFFVMVITKLVTVIDSEGSLIIEESGVVKRNSDVARSKVSMLASYVYPLSIANVGSAFTSRQTVGSERAESSSSSTVQVLATTSRRLAAVLVPRMKVRGSSEVAVHDNTSQGSFRSKYTLDRKVLMIDPLSTSTSLISSAIRQTF